jgi:hypothetical protein
LQGLKDKLDELASQLLSFDAETLQLGTLAQLQHVMFSHLRFVITVR